MKTITPFKTSDVVELNPRGNFSQVLVVKINADFDIKARLVARAALPPPRGGRVLLDWDTLEETTVQERRHIAGRG